MDVHMACLDGFETNGSDPRQTERRLHTPSPIHAMTAHALVAISTVPSCRKGWY